MRLRLELSRAKHASLAGHSRLARSLAALIPYYDYDAAEFFCADSAPAQIAAARKAGFMRLAALFAQRFARTAQLTGEIHGALSDLQFTSRYRVPFQFSRMVRQHLNVGSVLESSSGPVVSDLDGNRYYDLTGSYGVNLFGHEFYKECIDRGSSRVRALGARARRIPSRGRREHQVPQGDFGAG